MEQNVSKTLVRDIMLEFADLTGLVSTREAPQRYLWTDGQDIELITSIGYLIARESATQRVQQRPTGVFPPLQPHTPDSISPGGRGWGQITFQLSFSSTAYPHTAGVPESGTFPHNPARS
jgi:hypothetical protein